MLQKLCMLSLLLPAAGSFASTWHVNVAAAPDGDGSARRPFQTIQAAADRVNPGDTVVIAPGVYFETVRLRRFGAPDRPITFRADRIRKNRVIVTGADPAIRRGERRWQLADAPTGTWVTDYYSGQPARITYSGTDLFPYQTFDALMTFEPKPGVPGPQHGFYYQKATGRLYVRLRADGKYGPADPNAHTMAVSPPNGSETTPGSRAYNFGLLGQPGQDLYIVIDGLTFEAPGRSAVYVSGNRARIRNCGFTACREGGVMGRRVASAADLKDSSSDIVIEFCEWHNAPIFEDVRELVTGVKSGRLKIDPNKQRHHWWVHKNRATGAVQSYETGVIRQVGRNWTVRNCYIHDCFDGLANLNWGENTVFENNLFERCIDNAIETEDHGRNCHIRRNRFLDVWQSVSLQPLNGEPWAGPVYVYQNLFYRSREGLFWGTNGSSFKIGINPRQWDFPKLKAALAGVDVKHISLPGLLIFNNTIIDPASLLVAEVSGCAQRLDNVGFYNNLVIARIPSYSKSLPALVHYRWVNNRICLTAGVPSELAELGNQQWNHPGELLPDWERNSFWPGRPEAAVEVPGAPEQFKYIGALQSPEERIAEPVGIQEEPGTEQ